VNNPQTLDNLKHNIEREIREIDKSVLENVFNNFVKRCKLCPEVSKRHFENLLKNNSTA